MSYETLNFEIADNIATITLNRPDNANALNAKMAEELHKVSIICDTNEDIRCVVMTATGKLFCGGGDLAEMDAADDNQEAHLLEMATLLHAGVIRLAKMDAPLIVAVNGTAGGGGFSLVLAGDYVISSDKAKFISAYTASALTPDGSSTYFLAKHVGLLRAKELQMTNRMLTAEEACDWGMVSRVVPHDDLMDEAMKMARKFAGGPTAAYGGVKRLALTAFSGEMEAQLDKESISISSLMRGHDAPHGIKSFLHKEKPDFKGS